LNLADTGGQNQQHGSDESSETHGATSTVQGVDVVTREAGEKPLGEYTEDSRDVRLLKDQNTISSDCFGEFAVEFISRYRACAWSPDSRRQLLLREESPGSSGQGGG
jgi:hypothetical protein